MTIDNIFLCRCTIGIKVKNSEGQVIIKQLPKNELCFSADGVYYNLLDFKKYLSAPECKANEEECVIMAVRLNEDELEESVRNNLRKNKEALLYKIEAERKTINSVDEFIGTLPHVDLVWCKKGKVVEKDGQKGIISLPNETCVALLYKGIYYDLINDAEINRLNYEAEMGEVVAYSFVSIDPEELGDDYKDYVLFASLLLAKLERKSGKPKIFYLR